MPTSIIEPTDKSRVEVETREDFDRRLKAAPSLAQLTIQGVRLDVDPPDLSAVDITGTWFIGCRFASLDVVADLIRRGGQVIPELPDLPYPTGPGALYTPEILAAGFVEHGFAGMYDTIVYRHFTVHGGALPDVREALTQRLHDSAVDDALVDVTETWIAQHGATSVVGVMGGHAELRGSSAYRMAATLGWHLTQAGRLVVTGGGPGVMEAANLGAYFAGRPLGDLTAAIDALTAAPDFHEHDPYTRVALEVRAQYPADGQWWQAGGLSIPTWLYGHEPANLFAGRIAKYFSNAIREDTILRLARGGIVFAPGRAGTVQEIFQAATKTFYGSDGASGAYVFLDTKFWATLPAPDLLRTLLSSTPAGDLTSLVRVTDDIDEAVSLLTAP
jgi:predicted Rossmann-fold nucleotide-binding protein